MAVPASDSSCAAWCLGEEVGLGSSRQGSGKSFQSDPAQKLKAVTWGVWNSESNWLASGLLSLKRRAPARTARHAAAVVGGAGGGETLAPSAGGSTAHLQCKLQLQTVSKSTASRHTASLALSSRTGAGPIAETTRRSIILHHRQRLSVANTRWAHAVAPVPVLVLTDVNSLV